MTQSLVIAVIVVGGFGYILFRVHRHLMTNWLVIRTWRWLTGVPHHGRPITDAGWFRRGQHALTPTGHATRWWYLPRWQRTLHRTCGTFGVLVIVWAFLAYPVETAAVVADLLLAGLVAGCRASVRLARTRKSRREWLRPLHLAAHDIAGHPADALASSWITAVIDGGGAVKEAQLALPAGFPADQRDKDKLVSIASQKLGIESPDPSWRLAGPAPLLTLRHSPPPPGHVTMADLLKELPSCRDDEVVLGIGKNESIVKASLGSDSPHIAISMGTGAGKSNLAGWLMLQMMLRGSIVMILDAKRRLSYPWMLKDQDKKLVQLPCVAYAWTTPQMHAAMAWLSAELDRRGDVAFAGMDTTGKVHANVGNRMFIVAEELNLAVPRLRAYWGEHRDKDQGDPAKSPAFTGLGEVAFAGRQVRKHLVLVGQMLTAEATGSRDSSVKENCGIKLLSRYGPKGWRIMCDDVPMPPPSDVTGRVQVVTAGTAREAQTPLLDPVDARRAVLELGDAMGLLPHDMPCKPVTAIDGRELEAPPHAGVTTMTRPAPVAAGPSAVSLQEAVQMGILHPDVTLAGLQASRHRDPDFPRRQGARKLAYLYDAAELAAWDAGRR